MKSRQKNRVEVNLVCNFQKSGSSFSGHVKNISRNGLLTVWDSRDYTDAKLKEGEIWEVEIELPVFHRFAPNAFYCQAVVVRMGAQSELEQEVAFRIDRMVAADLKVNPARRPAPARVM